MTTARRFDGSAAIVTGGGGGLGLAIARRLAEEGASILLADMNAGLVEEAASDLTSPGIHAVHVDVTDDSSVAAMVAKAVAAFGRVDILVNSAGIGEQVSFLKQRTEDFERIVAVNLTGSYRCVRAVAPAMIAAGQGAVINISSVA